MGLTSLDDDILHWACSCLSLEDFVLTSDGDRFKLCMISHVIVLELAYIHTKFCDFD